MRHMKAEEKNVWIDTKVNEAIWSRSIQKPPSKIMVKAVKFEDGLVEVSLPDQ
jgi:large subunit ribosomal protein L31e